MSSSRVCFLPIEESGGEGMVKTDVWHESYRRWTLKEKKIAIARALGMDVRTVRKGLRKK